MSRIGKKPIQIPPDVEVKYKNGIITVKGPKGTLTFVSHPDINVKVGKKEITVLRPSERKFHKSLHGTTRQIIANMVKGVKEGFAKELEIVGTGYRAKIEGNALSLQLGFTKPIKFSIPPDIKIETDGPNKLRVSGIDKQRVGEIAAQIRKLKPPEPYKGKGIRYAGEYVRRKAGKAGVKE